MKRADSNFQVENEKFQAEREEMHKLTWESESILQPKTNHTLSYEMSLPDVENICSLILEKIIVYNENNLKKQWKNSLIKFPSFHSDEFPHYIKIKEYIERVINYINCDKHILILAMMNLDKFLELNSDYVLTKTNCYK